MSQEKERNEIQIIKNNQPNDDNIVNDILHSFNIDPSLNISNNINSHQNIEINDNQMIEMMNTDDAKTDESNDDKNEQQQENKNIKINEEEINELNLSQLFSNRFSFFRDSFDNDENDTETNKSSNHNQEDIDNIFSFATTENKLENLPKTEPNSSQEENGNNDDIFYAPTPQCSVTSSFSSTSAFPKNPKTVKECHVMTYGNLSHRKVNEDTYCGYDELMNYEMNGITHSVSLYCIFDGHNGEECAQICSREIDEIVSHEYSLFIDSFQSELLHLNNSNKNDDSNTTENEQRKIQEKEMKEKMIQETMKRIMKTLDEKVKKEKKEESGSCALICIIDSTATTKTIIMSNVGDSIGMIYSTECEMKEKMSEEHRITMKGEKERIEKSGGYIGNNGRVNGMVMVTRAIGDFFLKELLISEPFTRIIESRKEEHQYVVMGCDGLTDFMTSEEIGKELKRYKEEKIEEDKWCNEMIMKACENNSNDNITVIILDLF